MRNRICSLCMVLGAVFLLGSLCLFAHNEEEANDAQQAAAEVLPQLLREIEVAVTELQITEVEIDGYAYIGCLSLPTLQLELPVMADWDETRLKLAPCRYAGSLKDNDLVIMAHNYAGHFRTLSQLTAGDAVIFTDMNGNAVSYKVAAQDILAPTAVDEMTAGSFDLTLFTCTYGGQNRLTVYCNRI